jgi:SAM-dependent methyltransferase
MGIASRIWNMTPNELYRKIRYRLGGDKNHILDDILFSSKHMRPQRFYDFLSRYEAIISRSHDWPQLDFLGKRVLEIGCGPLLGFGPIAHYQGARSYTAVEPEFDDRILGDNRFIEGYFRHLHRDLSGLYGEKILFDDFMANIRDNTHISSNYLVDADIEGPFDIVISNSCLEHISPFAESMKSLNQLCEPDCRFIHLVDFGSHRQGENPFQDIYSTNAEDYIERFGRHINLLRPSEIVEIMREAGFKAGFQRYYSAPEKFSGKLHKSWSERFSEDELFTKVGIIFGPVDQDTPFPWTSRADNSSVTD